MRLVRIALANVNATVGACRSNVDRALALARAAAADGATLVAMPEQVIGGYPPEDLVQWRAFVDAQRVELLRFAREIGLARVRVRARPRRGARGRTSTTSPRSSTAVASGGSSRRRSCRSTTSSTRRARSLAARRASRTRSAACRSAISSSSSTSAPSRSRSARTRWSPDGPMRRRSYAGAEIVVNLSASPFRVGIAETRREMIATRAADCQATVAYVNLVGANDGLVFDGGGIVAQNGRVLLAREGAFARASRPSPSIWTAPGACAPRTRRGARTRPRSPRSSPKVKRACASTPRRRGREALRFPAPANKNFFLPETERPRSARDVVLRGAARRARARRRRLLREDGRVQDDRRRALGRPRQPARPRRRAALDRSALGRSSGGRTAGEGPGDPPRVLHADPLLVGRDARCGRAGRARLRRAARRRVDRRRVRARARGGREDAAARRAAHGAGAPERAGARPRRAHVDVGERGRRAVPADEQHEREGRRVRHDRRRRRGRAQRHRERARRRS